MRRTWLVSLVFLTIASLACSAGRKGSAGFRLPDGDPVEGRAVFVAYRCHACHVVAGECVVHALPFLACDDQARLLQRLQMLRGVGHCEPGHGRELVHRALALCNEFKQLQTIAAGQSLRQLGDRLIESVLQRIC